jgi:hypothetical protein
MGHRVNHPTATTDPADATTCQRTVVLTPHPLQRIGAFAMAVLGGTGTPQNLTPEVFDRVVTQMAGDLAATATVESPKDPGGFWLGASYLLWPNSAMNTTNRKQLTSQQRRERIAEWRTMPPPEQRPAVPCALCGWAACGFYGKVDVPLGASTAHRNTTARGHAGLALCFACLSSFHALPYGCVISGGRAAALHSWDDTFLQRITTVQVGRTRRKATVGDQDGKALPYAREVTALRHLRTYDRRLTAGVELIVFSNSNKEQVFEAHALEQPLAEWLRTTVRDNERRRGFGYLIRAHHTKDVPGSAFLARRAFRTPRQVLTRAVAFLRDATANNAALPGEAPHLVPLCFSYAIEVLQVHDKDVGRIRQLAEHIAEVLAPQRERGVLKTYENAHRDPRMLQQWLRKRAVTWTLTRGNAAEAFITADQWRLLFDSDGQGRLHQDLLFIAVLEQLHIRGWQPDDAEARHDLDDDLIDMQETQ